jgi:hypothetical protein
MPSLVTIPVHFDSLAELLASASRACVRESSLIRMRRVVRPLHAGDALRLALFAPGLTAPVYIDVLVLARTMHPVAVRVRYRLADYRQAERALGASPVPAVATRAIARQTYAALNWR